MAGYVYQHSRSDISLDEEANIPAFNFLSRAVTATSTFTVEGFVRLMLPLHKYVVMPPVFSSSTCIPGYFLLYSAIIYSEQLYYYTCLLILITVTKQGLR